MMKNTFLLLVFTFFLSGGFAQTAVNFNCNDCMGVNHDLFSELDEGKVIVICWVMPCGSCVGPALTTYNIVRSFQSTHPEKVFMYLVDDYANTNCSSLNSWANGYNISDVTLFSNAAINMEDYGSTGMPKIVVVADVNHHVFYNANNSVNSTQLQTAINEAINATITDIDETTDKSFTFELYPNPAKSKANIDFWLDEPADVQVKVFDYIGKEVRTFSYGFHHEGYNSVTFQTSDLNEGIYFLKFNAGLQSKTIKLVVAE